MFQHTAARRRLGLNPRQNHTDFLVSTHSRPKAAGLQRWAFQAARTCFNTQPPEGGWVRFADRLAAIGCFNTQPPEGGWVDGLDVTETDGVSTHSRPKAAGTLMDSDV